MTTPDPIPLLALRPPPSHARRQLLPRRLFGRHSLLSWFIFALTGIFVLLFLSRRNTSYSRSKGGILGRPSTKSISTTAGAGRKDMKESSFIPYETTSSFHPVTYPSTADTQSMSIEQLCAGFPHHLTENRIQAVLKIGHGEDPGKIAAQLNSVSACFSPGELLIFSDMDQEFVVDTTAAPNDDDGNKQKNRQVVHLHRAIDVLANLPSTYHHHADFSAYNALQAMIRNGTTTQMEITRENDPTLRESENTGWKLDKYKFLAGVERAWEMRPHREWYIFYETDSYIAWDGLFRMLTQGFDPDTPLYLGSPSPGRGDDSLVSSVRNILAQGMGFVRRRKAADGRRTWFANGGPGYVLSRGAMRALLGRKSEGKDQKGGGKGGIRTGRYKEPALSERYMDIIRGDCCGDSVLGWALWKAGVKLGGLFPMFNVYAAHEVVYTERMWCQPVLTMHKTAKGDMAELWRWEQGRRRLGRPLLYADLYEFRSPGLQRPSSSNNTNARKDKDLVRPNWDNTAYDRLSPSHDVQPVSIPAECRTACEQDPSCLQYLLRGETCVLMPFISYGAEKSPEINERNITDKADPKGWRIEKETTTFTAGWMGQRIEDWRGRHECRDNEVDWLWPSLGRYF